MYHFPPPLPSPQHNPLNSAPAVSTREKTRRLCQVCGTCHPNQLGTLVEQAVHAHIHHTTKNLSQLHRRQCRRINLLPAGTTGSLLQEGGVCIRAAWGGASLSARADLSKGGAMHCHFKLPSLLHIYHRRRWVVTRCTSWRGAAPHVPATGSHNSRPTRPAVQPPHCVAPAVRLRR